MSKFKTKARTIELLGRKQIRDSVTALAELMKNSYDADADWVRAYFNSNKDNIILVDNGMGMSQSDIEDKWLVLGTPSKNTKKRVSAKGRPYMGAKGIGRLAAASLSKHYIMVTKTVYGGYNIAYLYWDLFEDTTISLDEIEIPTAYNVDRNTLITSFSSIIDELVAIQLKNIAVYASATFNTIVTELFEQSVRSAKNNAQNIVKYLGLVEEHGTLLFMSELRDNWNGILIQDNTKINDDLTSEKNYKRLANFISTLNSAYKKQEKCDHDFVEIFKNGQIMNFHDDYNEEDFQIYDIKFEGIIERGIFKGTLFAKNTNLEALNKANKLLAQGIDVSGGIGTGDKYDCGPIKLKICHIEGDPKKTSLTPETFKSIREKIDILGGIGIYRDGVRVLPYGETENDYLEIERRRTTRAGVYVFSHRNIFGRIDISSEQNPNLEDKSSREGFIENNYYHYFINTLKNLLVKIALDFLSDARKDSFNIRTYMIEYYKKEYENRQKQEEYEKHERRQFRIVVKELKERLAYSRDKLVESRNIESGIFRVAEKIQQFSGAELLKQFLVCSQEFSMFEYYINELRTICTISIPERFSVDILNKEPKLYNQINLFNEEVKRTCEKLQTLWSHYESVIAIKEKEFNNVLTERRDVEKRIEVLNSKVNGLREFVNQIFSNIDKSKQRILEDLDRSVVEIKSTVFSDCKKTECLSQIDAINLEIKRLNFETASDYQLNKINDDIEGLRSVIESSADQSYADLTCTLEAGSAIIQKINQLLDNKELITQEDKLIGSLKSQNMILREEVDLYEDLANFGMTSEILNHEFNQFYTKANDAIMQLGSYLLDNNSKYWLRQIQIAFDAIYSRHSLLSPMYKVKSEKAKKHCLAEIVNGAIKLFEHTFKVEEIICKTDIPEDVQVEALPSHLYPALSNIISNSIYWLAGKEIKRVYVHYVAEEHALYIEDNGKGIQAENKNDIFNPFYSLKPNGRGLGLTITKRVLQKDGHDISVVEVSENKLLEGACFKITFKKKEV